MRRTFGIWAIIGMGSCVAWMAGCASPQTNGDARRDLLGPSEMGNWQLTPGFADEEPWKLSDGVYYAPAGSWVGHAQIYDDFVLECEFLFNGQGQGGIQIRGDRNLLEPWTVGYELDIDKGKHRGQGHIHFPINPKQNAGDALFEIGKWHRVMIQADGPRITVFLDGKEAIEFIDHEFAEGQICLESNAGGVRYRNLRIRPLRAAQ